MVPALPSPPSLKPSDAPTVETTLLPPTSTSEVLPDNGIQTTPFPYNHEHVTVSLAFVFLESGFLSGWHQWYSSGANWRFRRVSKSRYSGAGERWWSERFGEENNREHDRRLLHHFASQSVHESSHILLFRLWFSATVTSLLQSDTVGEDDVFDFDTLFAKKTVVKDSASTVQTTEGVATTEGMSEWW